MLQDVSFRTKLTIAAALPIGVAALIAVTALATGAGAVAGVAIVGILIIGASAFFLRQQLITRLAEVAGEAEQLATDRLPKLIEPVQPGQSPAVPEVIEGGADDDEIGRLVRALNTVEQTAAGAAAKQSDAIRRGLSDLVVNLVRRNQSLLDRQIEYIDNLESSEEDPDRLAELFGIDHLATRMRRNAESLLVLAGSEPPRRRGGAIPMNELVRVAMSEIEDYRNVTIETVDDAEIGPQAAFDLAHLLSEVLENATQFSPPETQVEINGRAQSDGAYLISVSDQGIGMNAEQLATYNQLLVDPPELDINLSRSLGFMVIGRLAKRNRLTVELAARTGGGVTALVLVPQSVLTGVDAPAPAQPPTPPPGQPSVSAETAAPVQEQLAAPSPVDAARPTPPTPPPNVPAPAPIPSPTPTTPPQPAPVSEAAPQVAATPAIAVPFDLPEESGWTPANIPDRGATSLGRRSAGPADVQAETVARPVAAPAADPARSDALSKLLGAAPKGLETPSGPAAGSPEPDLWGPTSAMPLPTRGIDQPQAETAPQAPAPAQTPAPVPGEPEVPAKLEEAIPSGERFDAGVDALLGGVPNIPSAPILPPRGSGGLVKRDRRKSQAPDGEGRTIPTEPAGNAATATSRKPEEVREMLARYRSGRNQTSDQPNGEANTPTTNTDSGGPA